MPDLSLPAKIGCRVDHDTHEPGRERAPGIVAADVAPGQQETFLGGIISILCVLQNGSRETARRGGVPVYQLSESFAVALCCLLGEIGVAHDCFTPGRVESLSPRVRIRTEG